MSLTDTRTGAYLFGALTGAFAALALAADCRGRRLALLGLSTVCGALSVSLEEEASDGDGD